MSVIALGIDLVEVERIRGLLQRSGERFKERMFREDEVAYCDACADPAMHYAARFAAKEAFAKALGIGVRAPATLPAIAVGHDPLGKPAFAYSDELAALLRDKRLSAHLSISDERDYAVAFVILEQA